VRVPGFLSFSFLSFGYGLKILLGFYMNEWRISYVRQPWSAEIMLLLANVSRRKQYGFYKRFGEQGEELCSNDMHCPRQCTHIYIL
jgi:hypothetical protein